MNILMVRLGALGDVVHAIPAAAALRAAFPDARLHWLVEAKHRAILDLVTVLDAGHRGCADDGRLDRGDQRLRQTRYDIALDFQGYEVGVLRARRARRASPAFDVAPAREDSAAAYSETGQPDDEDAHVIRKNLRLLRVLGVDAAAIEFPLAHTASPAADAVARDLDGRRFALINPGAAWPNKRWPAQRSARSPPTCARCAACRRSCRGLANRRSPLSPRHRAARRSRRRRPRSRISSSCPGAPP